MLIFFRIGKMKKRALVRGSTLFCSVKVNLTNPAKQRQRDYGRGVADGAGVGVGVAGGGGIWPAESLGSNSSRIASV